MTPEEPTTRIEAAIPEEVEHLSESQKSALEVSGEVEHADGPNQKRLNTKVGELTEKKTATGN